MGRVGQNNWEGLSTWVINSLKNIPQNSRILDAGAGELKYRKYCEHLVYVSQDFGQYEGTGDGKGLQEGRWDQSKIDIVSDIVNIPVDDKSFDAVLCTEVIEHLKDPAAALRELYRVLKSGGTLLLTAPNFSLLHFSPYHYYTGFTKNFYEQILQDIGFRVVEMFPNGNIFEQVAQDIWGITGFHQKYSDEILTKKELNTLFDSIKVLEKLNLKKKENASELSCYGYCVRAAKL